MYEILPIHYSNACPSRSPCNHSTRTQRLFRCPHRPSNRNLVSNGRFPVSSTPQSKRQRPVPWRPNRPTTPPFPRPLDQFPTPQHATDSLWRTMWSDVQNRLPLSHVEADVSTEPTAKAMLRGETDARHPRTTAQKKPRRTPEACLQWRRKNREKTTSLRHTMKNEKASAWRGK